MLHKIFWMRLFIYNKKRIVCILNHLTRQRINMSVKNLKIGSKNLYLVYIFLILQVLHYILLKQTNRYGNNYILWLSLLLLIFLILLQINLKFNKYLIFTEIFFLSLLIHFLFIPVVGLFGSDAQSDFYLIRLINEFGWSLKLRTSITAWPAQHLFINICSKIMEISLQTSARYIPSLISTSSLFFVFCLCKVVYKKDCVALYTTLLFSIISFFVFFHSLPVRECFAFFVMSAAIFVYLKCLNKNDYRITCLAVFFGLFLTICHHFTLIIFNFFLIAFWISYKVFGSSRFKSFFNTSSMKFSNLSVNYLILMFTGTLSYWIFVSFTVFKRLTMSILEFFQFGSLDSLRSGFLYPPLINIRTQVFLYSKILVFSTILIILIYEILFKKRKLNIYEGTIFLFVFIIFLEWFFTLFGFLKMNIYPERLELFAWEFLLIPVSLFLFTNLSTKGKPFIKFISILFIISFISMNMTQYPLAFYDPSSKPNYENGYVRFYHLPQEYSAVNWFNGDGDILADRIVEDLFSFKPNVNVYTDDDFYNGDMSARNYDWLIVRGEMFELILQTTSDNYSLKSPMNISLKTYSLINSNSNLNKLYSNNEVDIFSFS